MARLNGSRKSASKRRSNRGTRAVQRYEDGDLLHGIGQRLRPHTFVRTQTFPIGKIASDNGYAYQFFLAGLPDASDFTNLYDQYRILKVHVRLVLNTPNITTAYPRITSVVDYDDSTAPTVETDLLQYPNAKVCQFSPTVVQHEYEFAPRAATAMFQGVTTGYALAKAGQWLDGGYPTISHYGTKFFITNYNSTSTPNTTITMYASYQVQMKNAR